MSITSSMYTGISGLLNNAEAMNVIGNNLSNTNTIGFKGARSLFSDMMSVSIGNGSQIGRGVQLQKVDNIFGQGSFETTELTTDLAIQGSSFFVLKAPTTTAPLASQSDAILSRAGAFRVDGNRYLVNPDGYQVVDTAGNPIQFSDNATAITAAVSTFKGDPATTALTTALGSDITAIDATPTAAAAIAAAPPTSAQAALLALRADANAKNAAAIAAESAFAATSPASTADAVVAATDAALAAVQAYANAAGAGMTNATPAVITAFDTANSALTTQEGMAFSKVTKIDGDGTITYLDKAGNTNYYSTTNAPGSPTATGVPGQKIAVINPSNPGALEKMGGTMFRIVAGSGVPAGAFSVAANAANGSSEKIYSNSLEQSNVDMATQFVKMILTQRAYSANSKTITTADEMTQEVLNLKR